jgi:hypothetical protein
MDNKKRLDVITQQTTASQSAAHLKSREISEAIHGLSNADPSASHHESLEATKHYAAAIEKHLPTNPLKTELAALKSAVIHETEAAGRALTALEAAIQKKIVETHHVPEEAAVYMLLAKLSAFSRAILFGQS